MRISRRVTALLAAGALLTIPSTALGRVLQLNITSREPAFEGRLFGKAGRVEKLSGRAILGIAPSDPRNAVIADIDAAPRNAQGLVETSADVIILRPEHPNGALLLEMPNRGRALLMDWLNDASDFAAPAPAPAPAPAGRVPRAPEERTPLMAKASDAGNGFLLDQGYTIVWVGWQGDIPSGTGIGFNAPVLHGLIGTSRDMWTFADAERTKRVALAYPAAQPFAATLSVRDTPDGPPRFLPADSFRFVDPSHIELTRPANAPPSAVYELVYTATDPMLMGAGFAAVRDVASFLRYEKGPGNPISARLGDGVRTIATGVSQAGRALRDLLYNGFNEDERGRTVFDAMMPIIPGARRTFTNARFAQPGRNPGPLSDRLYPVDQFPFTYSTQSDPFTKARDGLLLRCAKSKTCPKVVQLDSEYEFWGSHASLNVADARGKAIPIPANVRLFFMAGTQHSSTGNSVSRPGTTCVLPSNPVRSTPILRATIVNIDAWIKDGREPPASRYPSVADETLVAVAKAYPNIPQLHFDGRIAKAFWLEQTGKGPAVRGEYPLLVPKAGADGNAVSGVRLPIIAAPKGTYTGWNPQVGSTSSEGLCTQAGGAVAFAATRSDREMTGDPRPSIAEKFPSKGAYVTAVQKVGDDLVTRRLMLREDADVAVAQAEADKLAKLGSTEE